MKKIFTILLLIVLVFSFVSCVQTADFSKQSVDTQTSIDLISESDEETNAYRFSSYDLEGFIDFIRNDGKTQVHNIQTAPLWNEYKENTPFLEWVKGKTHIPIPVTADGYTITYSCIGEMEYCFYISSENLEAQVTIEEIATERTANLLEITERHIKTKNYEYLDVSDEHLRGESKFGEYIMYDRHSWMASHGGETNTLICPPVLYFRYDNYLIMVADRRKPEAEKWDTHFLDCFDLEMYEIKR